jgi:hypothetical protein
MVTHGSPGGSEGHARRERIEKSPDRIRYGVEPGDDVFSLVQEAIRHPKLVERSAPRAGIPLAENLPGICLQDRIVIDLTYLTLGTHGTFLQLRAARGHSAKIGTI